MHWTKTTKKEEIILRISNKLTGRTFTQLHKQKISKGVMGSEKYQKGVRSVDRSEKLRKIALKQKRNWGPLNPNWNGGNLNYIKKQVMIRDNFTCKKCGLYDPVIVEVDHIESIKTHPELKMDMGNMQTLCPNCHRRKTLSTDRKPRSHRLKHHV